MIFLRFQGVLSFFKVFQEMWEPWKEPPAAQEAPMRKESLPPAKGLVG